MKVYTPKEARYRIGHRFGRLRVIGLEFRVRSGRKTYRRVMCECDCGKFKCVIVNHLQSTNIRSCGCYRRDFSSLNNRTHGLKQHKLYRIWGGIKARCLRRGSVNWDRYGGRGIGICQSWKNDFKAFFDWAIKNGWKSDLQKKESLTC